MILFISIKMCSFHFLTHSETKHTNECDICEYIITSNEVFFTKNDLIQIEKPVNFYLNKQVCYAYSYQFEKHQELTQLFSRPPPKVK